jgi:hypothetical protein
MLLLPLIPQHVGNKILSIAIGIQFLVLMILDTIKSDAFVTIYAQINGILLFSQFEHNKPSQFLCWWDSSLCFSASHGSA